MGGTTSQSRKGEDEDLEYDEMRGVYFSIKPSPLFVMRSKEDREEAGKDEIDGVPVEGGEDKAEES